MTENKIPLSLAEDQSIGADGETLQEKNNLQNSPPDSVDAAVEEKT